MLGTVGGRGDSSCLSVVAARKKEDEGWCLDMEGRRLANGSGEAVLSSPRNGFPRLVMAFSCKMSGGGL